jgi:hypothetical protein
MRYEDDGPGRVGYVLAEVSRIREATLNPLLPQSE